MIRIEYLLRFIDEDSPHGDITSEAIIPDTSCRAVIYAEEAGVIAGLEEARALFTYFGINTSQTKEDGDFVLPQDTLLSLEGSARGILLVERTALNIIGRMSGIATQTRKLAGLTAAVNPQCRIASTRKTCPGLRDLDKKAVRLGGGDSHRLGLSDGILIKDNHLAIVSLSDAIRAAKAVSLYRKIEAEVEKAEDALTAASEGADIILLDNMTPAMASETLDKLKQAGLRNRVTVEISGGISESNLHEYAALGIDVISLGALTHSVKNLSVTLEIIPRSG